MTDKFSLKDHLYNVEKVSYLARLISAAYPVFAEAAFVEAVMERLLQLELKARVAWIAEVLAIYLPSDFNLASDILIQALPPPLNPNNTDNDFGDYIFAVVGAYVVNHGLQQKYLKQSLKTLREVTKRFSMEDAMRSFLNTFTDETLAEYQKWVTDKNYHVRRLVSESTRPTLPWSRKLTLDYQVPLQFLDTLYRDPTRYVTRSVANHLNDISKKDAPLVLATLKRWQKEGRQTATELTWMTKHALRTLVKRGDTEALRLLGYDHTAAVGVTDFLLAATEISRGDVLMFSFALCAPAETNVMVDYVIDFMKANDVTKPKVFKCKTMKLLPGAHVSVTKRHRLKADATTFRLHPGVHSLSIQINGQRSVSHSFLVT